MLLTTNLYAFSSTTDRSPRQERQLSFIAEFSTDIRYIRGTDNIVPDALSLAPCEHSEPLVASSSSSVVVDLVQMAEAQRSDEAVAYLRHEPGSLILQDVPMKDVTLLCDLSTGRPRPIVPTSWTKTVFEAIHNLSHPGTKPTIRAVSSRFVWKGLKKDVGYWVKNCNACQSSKVG